MIEKLKNIPIDMNGEPSAVWLKINELVDAVNGILAAQEQYATIYKEDIVPMLTPENEEPAENTQDEMPRCPFCGEELSYAQEIDGGFEILTCDCPAGIWLFGNDKMWYNLEKTTTELDCTRKALDKAKWWLNEIVESHRYTPISTAEMALKEITALEQKEAK